jgi:uncharacterized membrane protein
MLYDAVDNLNKGAEQIEKWVDAILKYFIIVIDIVGALVIIFGIFLAICAIFKKFANERITLARTTGLGLELIMCGEIIRTITTRTKEELIILGIVIIIRAALAVLSHWELKNEREARDKEIINQNS